VGSWSGLAEPVTVKGLFSIGAVDSDSPARIEVGLAGARALQEFMTGESPARLWKQAPDAPCNESMTPESSPANCVDA
jgi:hypothetical protein